MAIALCASAQMRKHQGASMAACETAAEAAMGDSSNLARTGARKTGFLPDRTSQFAPDHLLVLVVDDNPVNLMLASELLASMGVETLLAADGAEALALACELRLDLILMDLNMPVLDGFAATAQIRRFERDTARARVPVVAYTSNLPGGELARLRECGFVALLAKPTDAATMQECLVRWCVPQPAADAPARAGGSPTHN
jgi:CheY-like chemotaxis protein